MIRGAARCCLLALVACSHLAAQTRSVPQLRPASALELVESEPVETALDRPELRDAWQVWPEMIARASSGVDLAQFYASDAPPSRLTAVIAALEEAVPRGVRVRFLADAGFARTYPEVLSDLARHGVLVRTFDVRRLTGGVLHAKYFVVDAREAYLGSQNFDWRSLTHIQELGVRFDDAGAVRALQDIFELDWALAGGMKRPPPAASANDGPGVRLVASPQGLLPDEKRWELPALVSLIDSARRSIRVQLLTYAHAAPLEEALLRAVGRGVEVQLLLSDWELRPATLTALRALDPRIAVRILTIPQASGPFIPFARVAHAKYCAVDGAGGWVGTSNWEPDYFAKSRNVGLILDGGQLPAQLEAFFLRNWQSPYAAPFDRAREYVAPHVSALRGYEGGPVPNRLREYSEMKALPRQSSVSSSSMFSVSSSIRRSSGSGTPSGGGRRGGGAFGARNRKNSWYS